jgi:hypothetical protein
LPLPPVKMSLPVPLGGFIGVFVEQPVKEAIKSILPSTRLN